MSNELQDSGYHVEVKLKKDGIYSAMLKFPGLLFEAGMSHQKEENFSVKVEVDRRPPGGAQRETHIINKYFMSGVTCFNLPTLFSGKINAVLTRNYVKGRDYYDLFWYLTTHKQLKPNIQFLKNTQRQFKGHEKDVETELENWESLVSRAIEELTPAQWKKIYTEMELLIEDRNELSLFTKENLQLLLQRE